MANHDILINWAPQETRVAVVENGAKAVAEEATRDRADPEFFAAHSIADLDAHSEHWLGQQGRITQFKSDQLLILAESPSQPSSPIPIMVKTIKNASSAMVAGMTGSPLQSAWV